MKKSLRKELIKWAKRKGMRVMEADFSNDKAVFEDLGKTLPTFKEVGRIVMKKPEAEDWMQWAPPTKPAPDAWAAYEGPRDERSLQMFHLHESIFARHGYYWDVPDECRVVSLMQNDGE